MYAEFGFGAIGGEDGEVVRIECVDCFPGGLVGYRLAGGGYVW